MGEARSPISLCRYVSVRTAGDVLELDDVEEGLLVSGDESEGHCRPRRLHR